MRKVISKSPKASLSHDKNQSFNNDHITLVEGECIILRVKSGQERKVITVGGERDRVAKR